MNNIDCVKDFMNWIAERIADNDIIIKVLEKYVPEMSGVEGIEKVYRSASIELSNDNDVIVVVEFTGYTKGMGKVLFQVWDEIGSFASLLHQLEQ